MRITIDYMKRKPIFAAVVLCCLFFVAAGCGSKSLEVAPSEAPAIPVSQPVERQVTDYVDFTGRIEAPEAVSVVPRVTGYLMSTPFKEGAEVKKDDVLFEIDPRPYQAQYDQAEGQVILNEARVREAMADNARAKELSKTPGAISKQDLDRYQAAEEEAQASVQAAKASLEVYKLNLGFCKVLSPLTGQISRYYLTPGNLVNQDQTQLTTVVSVDPMYVYFDIDENTVLRIRRAVNEGKIQRYQQGEIPIYIGLEGEDGYPHAGTVNFVNNQVNSGTGSITVRGGVPNPKPERGVRLLSPGMFVRVRLPIGKPHDALLVIDRAIGSDQGIKYVYLMDDKNVVQQQRVDTGALQEDGLRVIDSGLNAKQWVVIGGLQQVRPRMTITPDREPMPTLGAVSEASGGDNGNPPAASGKAESKAATPPDKGNAGATQLPASSSSNKSD